MKKIASSTKFVAVLLAVVIVTASCASSTIIQSSPTGAKVFINEQAVGNTPFRYSDSKIVGSRNSLRIEMEGYETLNTSFARNEEANVGAIIGGLFFLFPFLWTMDYAPVHRYDLAPLNANSKMSPPLLQANKSKAERLTEIKELLDKKLISADEYETLRNKVINEDAK